MIRNALGGDKTMGASMTIKECDTALKNYAGVQRLVARIERHQEAVARKNQRRKKKGLVKRLVAAEHLVDPVAKAKALAKIWRSVTPPVAEPIPPKFDRSAEATTERQAKLVDNLFHYATLAGAWGMAGYSPRHHASLIKILSSPFIRAEIVRRLNDGGKMRQGIHERAVAKLGWQPISLEDLI
jgi:hypothetical protein